MGRTSEASYPGAPDCLGSLEDFRHSPNLEPWLQTVQSAGGLEILEKLFSQEILKRKSHLACGSANVELAEEIAELLGLPLDRTMDPTSISGKISKRRFSEGEVCPEVGEVDKKEVYLFQSPSPGWVETDPDTGEPIVIPGINDHLMELFAGIDAMVRAGAEKVIVVMPHFPYARQDRKDRRGVPITSSMIAKMIEERGVSQICALDLHSEQITGSVKIPFDVHYSSYVFVPWAEAHLDFDAVFSPDNGGYKRASAYSRMMLGHPNAGIINKQRNVNHGGIETLNVMGEVPPRVLITDDLTSSCGTIVSGAYQLEKRGAQEVYALIPHGLFTKGSLEKLRQCEVLKKIITTNSIAHRPEVIQEAEKTDGKIEIVSIAPLLAEVIRCIILGDSTQHLFIQ